MTIPPNVTFSDLLLGHTQRLRGMGLFTEMILSKPVEQTEEVCEEVCEILGEASSCTTEMRCQTPEPPPPPRGDLIVTIEPSFDRMDTSLEGAQSLLSAIFNVSFGGLFATLSFTCLLFCYHSQAE